MKKELDFQGRVCKLIANNREVTELQKIERQIQFFYKSLSQNNTNKTLSEQTHLLETLQIPKLSDSLPSKGELTEKELYDAMKNIPNNKSPGSDWLTKECFLFFLDDAKDSCSSSIQDVSINKEFSVS